MWLCLLQNPDFFNYCTIISICLEWCNGSSNSKQIGLCWSWPSTESCNRSLCLHWRPPHWLQVLHGRTRENGRAFNQWQWGRARYAFFLVSCYYLVGMLGSSDLNTINLMTGKGWRFYQQVFWWFEESKSLVFFYFIAFTKELGVIWSMGGQLLVYLANL